MHPHRPPQSEKRQRELASKMASDFEAAPLHNKVHEEIGEDEQLALLLDGADWTRHAQEGREWLRHNTNISDRLGLLGKVTTR